MLKKETRLRKEYLYKKSQEQKEQIAHDQKTKLKAALSTGSRIPTELKKHAKPALVKDFLYDEHSTVQTEPSADDEYSNAGFADPKVVITTSRDPSSRLQQFAKEVRLIFPNSQRINRGNYIIKELVEACRNNSVTDLVILHEHRGVPDGFIISHFPHGPTAFFSLSNVCLRHDMPDIGTVSEAYPHLVTLGFASALGARTRNILRYLFPVPREDSKRVITFSNANDYISFRHHVYRQVEGKIELAECGPRFEMRLYQIKAGTIDIEEADTEWVLHSFMNTSHKKNYL